MPRVWRIADPSTESGAELSRLCSVASLNAISLPEEAVDRVEEGDLVLASLDAVGVTEATCVQLQSRGARVVVFAPRGADPDHFFSCCDEVIRSGSSSGEFAWRCARLAPQPCHQDPDFPNSEFERFGLYGRAENFLATLAQLERFASARIPVSIGGETGTGKELAARAVHYLGPTRAGPFVPVNCGALPDSLVENELFGHVAGAFTGGARNVEGLVARADGGLLFLDEVDSLSSRAQSALLRFLQDGEYRPLGGGALRNSECRVVVASNTSLEKAVSSKRLREDLYYRLAVAEVTLPPLRERTGDASLLASRFIQEISASGDRVPRRFAPSVLSWIDAQPWEGNVRELQGFVERQTLLCAEPIVHRVHGSTGPACAGQFSPLGTAKRVAISEFEKRYLIQVIEEAQGNVARAARLAGKERRSFYRLLAKHGLELDRVRGGSAPDGPERG